jgi:uncharacterized protein YjlB
MIHVQSILLPEDGPFPNHPRFPLLVYPEAFLPFKGSPALLVEALFDTNGWPAAWRNGVYTVQHYHSQAHEALGVYRGSAELQFGGPSGQVVGVKAGDAAVLPAGTAHRLIRASRDFAVVGAYPPGQRADLCYGKPGEWPGAKARIAQVPTPATDPVLGCSGGVVAYWQDP